MKKIIPLLLITILSSCELGVKEVDKYQGMSPKDISLEADNLRSKLQTDEAINAYQQILARYPTSKYAIQAKIEIAYTLYKADRHNEAIIKLNNYIDIYPNHASTPYAYYLRGVVSADKSRSILDELNITDRASRDTQSVKDALNYYIALIKKFPNSKYSEEAKSEMIILKNILARHELGIAIFYTNNDATIAAINRSKYIIKNYPQTPSVPAALHLMSYNYKLLGQQELAKDSLRVLEKSYPNYKPHYTLE